MKSNGIWRKIIDAFIDPHFYQDIAVNLVHFTVLHSDDSVSNFIFISR